MDGNPGTDKNVKSLSKKEAREIIDKAGDIRYYYSETFRYPGHGDDTNKNMFLRIMLELEYKSATVLVIPDKINLCRLADRNKQNVT